MTSDKKQIERSHSAVLASKVLLLRLRARAAWHDSVLARRQACLKIMQARQHLDRVTVASTHEAMFPYRSRCDRVGVPVFRTI